MRAAYPLWCLLVLCSVAAAAPAARQLPVFTDGQPRLYLDVSTDFLAANALERPVADFARCFQAMTGAALPDTARHVRGFDPAPGLRLETSVLSMEDLSGQGSENGSVYLLLTPTQRLEGNPLAGPGEKAALGCTWQRATGRLQLSLLLSNQPYYGPGYGPCTSARLELPAPNWQSGEGLRLVLELRQAGGDDLRAGYRLPGGDWVYTPWCNPAQAGADTREPGVSDKNGPQAWAAGWPAAWAGKTAAYVCGYAARGRQACLRLDDVSVLAGDRTLLQEGFAVPDGTAGAGLPSWCQGPRQGRATVEHGALCLRPDPDAWNTVGLVAASPAAPPPAGAVPLRLSLTPVPAGTTLLSSAVWQGWRREVSAGGVTLSACTRLGLQNALYALLDYWGCRWVMVGELGECLPRVRRLSLPMGSLRFAPRANFAVAPCGSGNAYADFYERNQGGCHNWLTCQHYWFYALPPEKYFAEHPDWYSLIAGKRVPRQLCTSNPEVIAAMVAAAKAYLRGGQDRVAFPMDPQDCPDFCECDRCRALDPPGRYRDGIPVVTDRVLHFVNAVAAGIRDEFPDRYVGFYAYWSHDALPLRERPADNVVVGITRMNYCLLHLTPTKQCPKSDFGSFVRQWQKLTPRVFVYEYDPISWTGGLPCPIYLEMGRALHTLLAPGGVLGSYSDMGVLPAAHAGTFLNRYLPLRMKVNPEQRPEDVLHDLCGAFFGPAAAPMEQHYLRMAESASRPHPGLQAIGVGTTYYHRLFTPAQIRQARAALDRAQALTRGHAPYEQRVAMVDLAQQYLEAYLGGVWAAGAGNYEAAVAEFDRLDRTLAALAAKGWVDGKDAPGRARAMRAKALAEHFPGRLGYVTDWQLLGPFDNSANAADKRREPFEPLTSLDPVALPQGGQAAWWRYRSPGGFLNLEQALAPRKPAQHPWTLSYAFAATTYEAPRALAAQLRCDSFFPFRAFLNGEEVLYKSGLNADCPDRQVIDVRLRPGKNLLVVKLCQTQLATDSFPWGLYLRVVPDETVELVPLPERWALRTDPDDRGVAEQWFAPGHDAGDWRSVRIGQPWEGEIGPYDGFAWYRTAVKLPALLPPGRLALQFSGVDEEAWVYVNGRFVGERSVKSTGRTVGEIWEEPFTVPLPREVLRPGVENTLAVRVHDSAYAGGLYRGVKLVTAQ